MSRRRCVSEMIGIYLIICVQTRIHTAGPPVYTLMEILSPVYHL